MSGCISDNVYLFQRFTIIIVDQFITHFTTSQRKNFHKSVLSVCEHVRGAITM